MHRVLHWQQHHVRHFFDAEPVGFHHHDGAYVRLPDCRDHRRMADVAQAQGQAYRKADSCITDVL